MKHKS